MSTFIEVRPEESPDTRTTAIRIDDDLKVTIRTEKTGAHTDYQFNYTGVDVGIDITTSEPVEYVRVTKIGDDVRATVAVKCYHLPGQANTVPAAGIYWYNPSTHYNPELPAEMGKTAASDPTFEGTTQAFPVTIFAPDPITPALPVGNTIADPTIPRLYARLGSLEARRAYLKRKLLSILESNDFYLGAWEEAHVADDSNSSGTVTYFIQLMAKIQGYMRRMKMLALTLSIDANLDTEQKFNLLNGEIGYDPHLIGLHLHYIEVLNDLSSSRLSSWRFGRLGRIGRTEPWTWLPSVNSTQFVYRENNVAGITFTVSSMPQRLRDNNGAAWLEWLRE